MPNLGARIKTARKTRKMTQKDLASKVEVHWNTVARWERNEIECRIDQIVKIAEVTEHPVEWFFSDDKDQPDNRTVMIDSVKFRIARERNNYSVKEAAVLLELSEEKIEEIERSCGRVDVEYLHRMLFVLGFFSSWYLEADDKLEWNKDDSNIYQWWIESGIKPWKFKEHFYNLWDRKLITPPMEYEDMARWLRETTELWRCFYQGNGKSKEEIETVNYLKNLVKKLNNGAIGEAAYFLDKWKTLKQLKEETSRISQYMARFEKKEEKGKSEGLSDIV